MSNTTTGPEIAFLRESGKQSIRGDKNETLFQIVEGNWHNLSNAVLRRFSGNRADLCDADLRNADLYSADLTCARLLRANMTAASLYGASLAGADLQEANLSGADLYRSDMRSADLRRARLDAANMERAVLSDADLRGATYTCRTRFPRDFEPQEHDLRLIEEEQAAEE